MAGASFEIQIHDQTVRDGLAQLRRATGDLTPFFQDLGEALLNSTRARFRSQTAPDGAPWAALSPGYARRKKRNRDKILTRFGRLAGTLRYQAHPDELQVGTSLIYGATHQFGRPERNIPARPFLGLSDEDQHRISTLLRAHLARAAGNSAP